MEQDQTVLDRVASVVYKALKAQPQQNAFTLIEAALRSEDVDAGTANKSAVWQRVYRRLEAERMNRTDEGVGQWFTNKRAK